MDCNVLREDLIQRSLERRDPFSGVDLLQKLSNKRFVRLDETEAPVWIFLRMAATDPQTKLFIDDGNDPAPILGKGRFGFESFIAQLLAQKVSERFAPETRIDLLYFSVTAGNAFERNSTQVWITSLMTTSQLS